MKKNSFHWQKSEKLLLGIPLAITTLIMAAMVIVILLNTYHLNQHLEHYAESYSDDVAEQLANRISLQIKQKVKDVENLADSLSKMPNEVLTADLLKRKETNLDINNLFILNEDGTTFPEQGEIDGLDDYLQSEHELEKQSHISFLDQNQVILSTPFIKHDSYHLLIAICTGSHLQQMLEDFNYEDNGRCCIIDRSGTVIVSPTNMQPFHDLRVIFDDSDLLAEFEQPATNLLNSIQNGESGLTVFRDIKPHSLIVGYDFLGICDWILLSVIPLDFLSNTVEEYTTKFILIALALILAIIGIIFLLIRTYQKNMDQIKKAALTDPLTQGDNTHAFRMRCEYRLKEAPELPRTIIYMNNKDFRSYNSRFGVNCSNEILHLIYKVIESHLNEHELVARSNGTSFYVLLTCQDKAVISHRLKNITYDIREKLLDQYSIDNHLIAIGAYLIPEEHYDFLHMLDWAKIASTYNVKNEVCKFFDDSIVQIMLREEELDNAFSQAIKDHEFKLYIQPKVSPINNQLLGGEVLVRWQNPTHGLIPPNDFIPLFEKNGKICTLDFYMFEETCKLLRKWLDNGTAIPLSVNLSRAHMGSHNFRFLDHFRDIKEKYQIPDGLIELELTESIILERQEVSFVLEAMNRIQSAGFSCSLDDFGFGYSCLTLLKDLNINTIKLDRQFFLNENDKSWLVIGQLIQMAHQLQISVVAEGVEEWCQVEKLKSYHCDLIQGYIYAKPMDVCSFVNWAISRNN